MAITINNVKGRVARLEDGAVRVSKEKAAENRARILTEAARLFREHGLGVGVDALTEAAGMTHGSLYSQFGSKERLAEAALLHAMSSTSARMSGAGSLDAYVGGYLSAEHCERVGDGCAMAALGGEMPRQGAAIRRSFTDAVRAVTARVAGLMPQGRGAEDEALGVLATMVGALILARAVDDPALSDRLLAAGRALVGSRC
jgi:TetR/AcrR family transcriptional repressor of nem operon